MALTVDPVVSAGWLLANLADPSVRVLDATWHFPHEGRSAEEEFRQGHIPGAARFDVDAVSEPSGGLPHMLPSPEVFAAAVGALGVGTDDLVVAYEATPPRAAARAWWSFRAMGHDKVRVLDGGLPAYLAAGGVLEGGAADPRPAAFSAKLRRALVRSIGEVEALVAAGKPQLLDARPLARFLGEADEPRAGLRRGRLPGALSVPSADLFSRDGRLLPAAELLGALRGLGVDPDAPAVATCGSGLTACLIALAFARLGRGDVAVYDGSFAEWGRAGGPPVASGPP